MNVERRTDALEAVLAGLLGAIAALYAAHGRVTPYDNYVLFADALLHGRLWIDPHWPGPQIDAVLFGGHRYIVNDPVPGILMLPLVALFGLRANQTLLAALLCGVATAAAWTLMRRIGLPRGRAAWVVLFALLGTDLLWCSMLGDVWFVAQTSAFAFALLALAELAGPARPLLVALWLVLAIGSRFTLVMSLPVVLWWLTCGFRVSERRPRALAATLPVLIPAALVWVAYNFARWHVPWDAGHTVFYHQDPYLGSASGSPFSLANVPWQLYSFFALPPAFASAPPFVIPDPIGTALIFTSPALVLAAFARRPRRLVLSLWLAAALTAVPSLLYYVNGGAQFGMRHALDFEPFLLVLVALAVTPNFGNVAKALLLWSMAAGIYGVWFWSVYVRPAS